MRVKAFSFVIFLLILVSCKKDINYDSIVYRFSSFGSQNYHLNIKKDGRFFLTINHGSFESENDIKKTAELSGTIDDSQAKQINKALKTLTSKGYQYNNPEMFLDDATIELTIMEGKSSRTYQTNHPTPSFEKDVANVFNEICEKAQSE